MLTKNHAPFLIPKKYADNPQKDGAFSFGGITDHKQDGYYTFPLGRFFGMWREGVCAEKEKPYVQPYVIAKPKDI